MTDPADPTDRLGHGVRLAGGRIAKLYTLAIPISGRFEPLHGVVGVSIEVTVCPS